MCFVLLIRAHLRLHTGDQTEQRQMNERPARVVRLRRQLKNEELEMKKVYFTSSWRGGHFFSALINQLHVINSIVRVPYAAASA